MRLSCYRIALSGLLLAGAGPAFGQVVQPTPGTPAPPATPAPAPTPPPAPAKSAPYGAGLKMNLSPDGSKYLRFIAWAQVWASYNENNSNTTRNGAAAPTAATPPTPKFDQLTFDMRRVRMILLAQLNPRFLTYIDFGIANQNAVSGRTPNEPTGPGKKTQMYIHEAVAEYRLNKYLSVGGGLNYQVGVSRMTAASTANMLAYDVPIVNWPTLEQTDQFAFFLGFYGKGRIGNVDYRLAVDDAFVSNTGFNPASAAVRTNAAQFNPRNTSKIYQGYASYAFFEKEANLLPFTTGSYLGTKKVLNVGAGYHYNADATISRAAAYPVFTPQNPQPANFDPFSTTRTHDIKLFGADIFYDAPIDTTSKTALTVYGVYYNYDFGPNYVRNIGILNPGTGSFGGIDNSLRGNAFPLIGTGHSFYVQSGLLLPKNLLGPKARIQPYVAYLRNSFEGLLDGTSGDRKIVNVYDAGLNLLLDGHNAKLTLNYRARPDFTDQTPLPTGQVQVNSIKYRPEVTLQAQVYL